jgi:hypothetical protein
MRSIVITALLLALPALAYAEEPLPVQVPNPSPSQICKRGTVHVRLGGTDLDELKCAYFMLGQRVAALATDLAEKSAELLLANEDIEAAHKAAADAASAAEAQKAELIKWLQEAQRKAKP